MGVSKSLDIREEMIQLYVNLESALNASSACVLQFIGVSEGEGTSTLAREFARVSARDFSQKVVVLDADPSERDLQPPSEPHRLQPKAAPLPLLIEKIMDPSFEQPQEPPFLTYPLPRRAAYMSSIYNTLSFEDIFDQLKERLDLVVIDSPPLTVSSYGLYIAGKVDGVVLIVEAEKNRWPHVKSSQESLVKAGGHILGLVLNKRRNYLPSFLNHRVNRTSVSVMGLNETKSAHVVTTIFGKR